jgi:nicotinate phosphoribosyltransferase
LLTPPPAPYGQSLALLTDLYELTMAYGYWKSGMADREAVFHLYFRRAPFGGAFAIACGIGPVADFLRGFHFAPDDLDYLRTLRASDGGPLFEAGFLDYLQTFELHCDIDAVPEGTAVFAHEPLVRVRGPLLQAQILETALLNIVNFQTLIATKAARIALAAQGEPILEFGLRRAQGIDGGLAASRAAYAGGCSATSNVLAGKLYGIPVRGTHAHSWVMSFDSELEAFHAWARAMPANCIFLVDTYDTIEGVRHAIEAGKELRRNGREMLGIRLDSGDLAALSREARRMLDDAGFPDARIVASGDLDEHRIADLHAQGARIAVWGVGTRLTTAYEEPALGGVYKLGAIRENGAWSDRLKLSDDVDKISNPGVQQVRRYSIDGRPVLDVLYDASRPLPPKLQAVSLDEPFDPVAIPAGADAQDLLQPLFRDGVCLHEPPSLEMVRARAERERNAVSPEAEYPVALEAGLHQLKQDLIARHGLSASRTG